MWASLTGATPAPENDDATAQDTAVDGASADESTQSAGGLWGSLSSFAGGIKSAVDDQIAQQAAEMEKEQARSAWFTWSD